MECKYKTICNLPVKEKGDGYCWLHDTSLQKGNSAEFKDTLIAYIQSGNTNFQRMVIPDPTGTLFEEMTFSALSDFSHAILPNGLNLNRAHLKKGLKIEAEALQNLSLIETTIEGNSEIEIFNSLHSFNTHNTKFLDELRIIFRENHGFSFRAELRKDGYIKGKFLAPHPLSILKSIKTFV